MRALIVEDEQPMLTSLRITLSAAGYDVICAASGNDALDAIRDQAPDVVILDLGLPDMDGKEVLRQARVFSFVPILVLSARVEEGEKIAALDLGANAYIEKPFNTGELLVRMRAALRDARHYNYVEAKDLVLDMRMRWVKKNGAFVKLTRSQYDLLVFLARAGGEPKSRREILRAVWGEARENDIEGLRVLVRQLRVKIEDDPAAPRLILSEPGFGYRFGVKPEPSFG
jgi:two-component system, OmpR family, KDP operon response regulator KdpE